jgi:hypothetical protein
MKQEYLDEIKQHQSLFFDEIDRACLSGKLSEISETFPDFKEKVIKNLRWGLFLRKNTKSLKNIKTKPNFSGDFSFENEALFYVSSIELQLLENEIKAQDIFQCPIFSDYVYENIKNKDLFIDFECHDFEVTVQTKESENVDVNINDLLSIYELRLTLPESEDVLNIIVKRNMSDWEINIIDTYDQWKWDFSENQQKRSYLQVGGHGSWIQYSYDKEYIAQVNNDVGDCGSVYVYFSEQGKFKGHVDMY